MTKMRMMAMRTKARQKEYCVLFKSISGVVSNGGVKSNGWMYGACLFCVNPPNWKTVVTIIEMIPSYCPF